jgi:hypothetical protein
LIKGAQALIYCRPEIFRHLNKIKKDHRIMNIISSKTVETTASNPVVIVRVEYRMPTAKGYITHPIAVTQYTEAEKAFCAPKLYKRDEYEQAEEYARTVALLHDCEFELYQEV